MLYIFHDSASYGCVVKVLTSDAEAITQYTDWVGSENGKLLRYNSELYRVDASKTIMLAYTSLTESTIQEGESLAGLEALAEEGARRIFYEEMAKQLTRKD